MNNSLLIAEANLLTSELSSIEESENRTSESWYRRQWNGSIMRRHHSTYGNSV